MSTASERIRFKSWRSPVLGDLRELDGPYAKLAQLRDAYSDTQRDAEMTNNQFYLAQQNHISMPFLF